MGGRYWNAANLPRNGVAPHPCLWCGCVMRLHHMPTTPPKMWLQCGEGARGGKVRCPVHPFTKDYTNLGWLIRVWNKCVEGA